MIDERLIVVVFRDRPNDELVVRLNLHGGVVECMYRR